jgi:hypothetical protein
MAGIHFLAFKKTLAVGLALLGAAVMAAGQANIRYYPLSKKDFYLELGNRRFYLVLDPMWRAEPESKTEALKEELKARSLPDESVMVANLTKGTAGSTKLKLDGELLVDASKEREISLTFNSAAVTSAPPKLVLQKTGDAWLPEDPSKTEDLAKFLKIKKDVLILRLADGNGKMKEAELWNRLAARLQDQPNFVIITEGDGIAWVHAGAPEVKTPPKSADEPPKKQPDSKDEPAKSDWVPLAIAGGGGLVVGLGLAFALTRSRGGKRPKVEPLSPNLLKLTEFVQGQVERASKQGSDKSSLEKAAVAEMLDRYAKYGEVSAENQRLQQYRDFQDNFDKNVKIVEQHRAEKEAIEAQMRRLQAEKEQAERSLATIKSEQRGTENQIEALRAENQKALDVVEQSDKLLARYEELLKQFGDSMADELGKSTNKQ